MYFDIEKPLVVLAETVEFIEPAVLATPVPFAFQFHDAKGPLLSLLAELEPTVKPSLSKEFRILVFVSSAALVLLTNNLVTPLIESC